MATSTTTSTRVVEITDPTLLNFHTQREVAYSATEKQIAETLPPLEEASRKLPKFYGDVRTRGSNLQAGTVEVPTQAELDKEKEGYLATYQAFKAAHDATALLSVNISGTIAFLKPIQGEWALEESLKQSSPELYAQMKRSEEICLSHIDKLREANVKVEAIKTDLITQINGSNLTWSLQRFCHIVDNNGRPLGALQRCINYASSSIFTPIIPTPDVTATTPSGKLPKMHDLKDLTMSVAISFSSQSTGGSPTTELLSGVESKDAAAVGDTANKVSGEKEPVKQEAPIEEAPAKDNAQVSSKSVSAPTTERGDEEQIIFTVPIDSDGPDGVSSR